jgi:quercetin dioxygenase-like cupin family protein
MDVIRGMAGAVRVAGGGFALPMAHARQPGMARADLLQHDLSIADREVIQTRIDFEPGSASLRHSHPGDEVVYVLEGRLAYELRGRRARVLEAGETLFIPAGTSHTVRNAGPGRASQLATYLVRKGRPLLIVTR